MGQYFTSPRLPINDGLYTDASEVTEEANFYCLKVIDCKKNALITNVNFPPTVKIKSFSNL